MHPNCGPSCRARTSSWDKSMIPTFLKLQSSVNVISSNSIHSTVSIVTNTSSVSQKYGPYAGKMKLWTRVNIRSSRTVDVQSGEHFSINNVAFLFHNFLFIHKSERRGDFARECRLFPASRVQRIVSRKKICGTVQARLFFRTKDQAAPLALQFEVYLKAYWQHINSRSDASPKRIGSGQYLIV
jgi:hypothetical protein